MCVRVLLALVPVLLLAAEGAHKPTKEELKKLQGKWLLVSGEKEGEKVAQEHVEKSYIVWKGQRATVHTPHQTQEIILAEVVIDPSKNPKLIDWVRSTGPWKGKKMEGIYEFLGKDEFRVCFAVPGKERPKEFSTKPGSGHILHQWKRVKE